MQVTETSAENLKREFKVIVPKHDVQEKIDLRLSELGQRIRLPGFRPGKVPLPVLKQRYGRSILGEIVEQAVSDSSARVISERGLRAVGQPKIEIVSNGDDVDLEYTMAVELIPDIKPMDFRNLEFERLVVEVPEPEITAALERAARSRRKSQPITTPRPAQTGEVVVIDHTGRIEGEEFAGGSGTGHYLELGSRGFLPGFDEQLIGASAGEKRTVRLAFPSSHPNPKLAGKEAEFEVEVREIRELLPLVLDDNVAKEMGAESLEALRASVGRRLGEEYAVLSRARLKRQLLDALAAEHSFAVPPGLLESEFAAIWNQIEADRKAGRLDPEDAEKSDEQLKKEYGEIAERRVRLGLLLSEVGRLNNIQVANDELSQAVVNEAKRHPGQERQVIEFYQKSPQALLQLRAPLYEDKVVNFILELARVTERRVTPDELMREVGALAPVFGQRQV